MSIDHWMDELRRGVDRGVKQVRRTADMMEAEARLFALQKKVGLRVYQLWKAGQLSHPDLEEDLLQMEHLEETADGPLTEEQSEGAGDLDPSSSGVGGGTAGAATKACPHCGQALPANARFCTGCGKPLDAI